MRYGKQCITCGDARQINLVDYLLSLGFHQLLIGSELGLAVEKNSISEKQAIEMEVEIRDFILAEVQLSMENKTINDFDLNNSQNQKIIETIFQTAYSTLQQ